MTGFPEGYIENFKIAMALRGLRIQKATHKVTGKALYFVMYPIGENAEGSMWVPLAQLLPPVESEGVMDDYEFEGSDGTSDNPAYDPMTRYGHG